MREYEGTNPGALYGIVVIWIIIGAIGLWFGGILKDNGISFDNITYKVENVIYADQMTYSEAIDSGVSKSSLDYYLFNKYVMRYKLNGNKFSQSDARSVKSNFNVRPLRLTNEVEYISANDVITPSVHSFVTYFENGDKWMYRIWIGFCFVSCFVAGLRISMGRISRGEAPLQEL